MPPKRRRASKLMDCAECAGYVVDPVTCATCVQLVCYETCGRHMKTVMWIGRPVDTFACKSCISRMKLCCICCGWSTSNDTMCVRCISKYCETCHRKDRTKVHKICHNCMTHMRTEFTSVVKAPDAIQSCILDYMT